MSFNTLVGLSFLTNLPGEAAEVWLVETVRHIWRTSLVSLAVERIPVSLPVSGVGALQVDAVVVARLESATALLEDTVTYKLRKIILK